MSEVYSNSFVADNKTLTTMDMGELGGLVHVRSAVLADGNSIESGGFVKEGKDLKRRTGGTLVSFMSNRETNDIILVVKRTRKEGKCVVRTRKLVARYQFLIMMSLL